MDRRSSLLEDLGSKYGPSKLGGDYLRRYAPLLDPIRGSVTNVVEIGIEGGKSLKMWRDYFPNAVIHGIDIDPGARVHEGDRIRVTLADSTDPAAMRSFIDSIPGTIQVMIDDGSHHPFDQIATFKNLFPSLANGGLYLLEDVGGTRGPLRSRALKSFIEMAEAVNHWPRCLAAYRAPNMAFDTDNYWIKTVVGVSFFRYLVIVEKGRNPTDNIFLKAGPGEPTPTPRPALHRDRLRELPWPRYRPRRHFVKRSEVRPEGVLRLGLRYLLRRW